MKNYKKKSLTILGAGPAGLALGFFAKKKIILVSIDKSLSTSQIENLGAKFYDFLKNSKQIEYTLNSNTVLGKSKNVAGFFLNVLKLK